ncbi:hypothetical protein SAY86_029212 [Trapa natans]|uniref:Uncharacterized protein n=1 Tax=Trapa natans TaxID=22666 RepID=A0AAN7M0V4_TRANT|nr:hypothetical protein SAY86_029212 [Trapa natans]
MYDFCVTIPYGILMVVGGIVGYLSKGKAASLGGAGAGLLLFFAGYSSLKAFEKRKNSYFDLILETITAAALTFIMGQRYIETSKVMPAGIVAGLSALMTGFYVKKVVTGGNHIPTKAE